MTYKKIKPNKILIIQNGTDKDIVTNDGGYAFYWTADGKQKITYYQNRITKKLKDSDDLNEILENSKSYHKEYDKSAIFSLALTEASAWLGYVIDDTTEVNIIEVNSNKAAIAEINKFLNF